MPTADRRPKFIMPLLAISVAVLICALLIAIGELVARSLEPKAVAGLRNIPDNVVGWLPAPGNYRGISTEFSTPISVNSLNMNDREPSARDHSAAVRILALGDSHTFAIGAGTEETWPKQLEAVIAANRKDVSVLNAGVIGYSLGQYLLRYRMLRERLKPNIVLVGFSMATDLYDLVPPERGGFIYGGTAPRHYFDLDNRGELVERIFAETDVAAAPANIDRALAVRSFLEQFALFRAAKRSNLAMKVAVLWEPGGKSLWPGLSTALKIDLNSDDRYRWALAERILGRLVVEARENGADVMIISIPYLAQVYDDVWAGSFGLRPQSYDRTIASTRMQDMSSRIGASHIDLTKAFQTIARERRRWLHWPRDAHPTPEGHTLIAQVVAAELQANGLLATSPGQGR